MNQIARCFFLFSCCIFLNANPLLAQIENADALPKQFDGMGESSIYWVPNLLQSGYAGLHEMAHIGTSSIGHTPEFWNNFAWVLEQAEAMNLYKYQDFAAHPVEYCGVQITDSPKYKEGMKDDLTPA